MNCQRPLPTDRDRTRPAKPVCDRLAAIAAGALLATFAAATPPAAAASHRLSQGLPFSDVPGFAVSADGQFAVYTHDAEIDQAQELWSVRVAGGTPVRLSNPLPGGVGVNFFRISADSQRVVFTVAQETAGQTELYSVPIAGPEGAWIKLNGELPADGDVGYFVVSPDSSRVIYFANQTTSSIYDAWTVPIDGGTPIRLRPLVTLVGSKILNSSCCLQISPDSERVLFYANFSDLAYYEIWSARVDGNGGIVRLTETTAANGNVFFNTFSPDSSRVVYVGHRLADGIQELYSVPSAGGSTVKLNGVLTPGGNVWTYKFSPDSSRVVYLADQQTLGVNELYSVPLAGGGAAKLNGPLSGGVGQFRISPDSASVAYVADQDTPGVEELYRVPLAGGGTVKLNPTLASDRDITDLEIDPNGGRVVYLADQNHDEVKELFSVPLAGGTSDHLNDIPVSGGDVSSFTIAPLGGFVFYRGDILTNGLSEIFRTRIAGSSSADVRLNGPLVAGGALASTWAVLPDGRQVVYSADEEVDERDDLYVGDICLLCDGFEAGDLERWN